MGFFALLLVVVLIYALIRKHQRENKLESWTEAFFSYLDGVL